MTMNTSPEFWTPQELTEEELSKICNWLFRWQSACVTANSVCEENVSGQLDPAFQTAMSHIQDLIRHIHALRIKK